MSTMWDAEESLKPRNKAYALRATVTDDFGNEVSLKRCKTCFRWLEDGMEFYCTKDRQYATCKNCVREKQKQHRQKPEVLAARKEYNRVYSQQTRANPYIHKILLKREKENRDRNKNTPEYKAKRAKYDKNYRLRIYADPKKHAEFLEKTRIQQRLQRERKGIPSMPQKGIHHLKFPVEDHRVRLPVGPIRAWLNQTLRNAPVGKQEEMAAAAGLDSRYLRRIRNEAEGERVELFIIERLLKFTDTLVEDLYPDLDDYFKGEEAA